MAFWTQEALTIHRHPHISSSLDQTAGPSCTTVLWLSINETYNDTHNAILITATDHQPLFFFSFFFFVFIPNGMWVSARRQWRSHEHSIIFLQTVDCWLKRGAEWLSMLGIIIPQQHSVGGSGCSSCWYAVCWCVHAYKIIVVRSKLAGFNEAASHLTRVAAVSTRRRNSSPRPASWMLLCLTSAHPLEPFHWQSLEAFFRMRWMTNGRVCSAKDA